MLLPRLLSTVKGMVVPSPSAVHHVRAGILQGVKMRLDLSHQTQLYLGLYEKEIQGWIRKLSKDINTAIDVGAGPGHSTLFFMLKTQTPRVFAFEPMAEHRAELNSNLALNGCSDSPRLQLSSKWVNSYLGQNEVTLDSLIPQMRPPVLVKLALDTLEVPILKGAAELLKVPDVRWIIATSSDEIEQTCRSMLEKVGYKTRIVTNAWWRLFVPEIKDDGPARWIIATQNHVPQTA